MSRLVDHLLNPIMLSLIFLNCPFSLNLILTFYKVVNLEGNIRAGSKTISCTFKLVVCEGVMINKESEASCRKKGVKKPAIIPNISITGNGLIFTFTLRIPRKGRITFSDSKVTPVATTTTTTSTTTNPQNTTPGKFETDHKFNFI